VLKRVPTRFNRERDSFSHSGVVIDHSMTNFMLVQVCNLNHTVCNEKGQKEKTNGSGNKPEPANALRWIKSLLLVL